MATTKTATPTRKPAKKQAKPAAPAPAGRRKPSAVPNKPVVGEPKPSNPLPAPPTHDQIAAKAYEIWVAKGRPIGQDDQNWDEAEKALNS